MFSKKYSFISQLIVYESTAAWHFLTLPIFESADIKANFTGLKTGWGSIFVKVTIGHTTWSTSIFPSKKDQAYLLPVKKSVRQSENLYIGDKVKCMIEIEL
jgi:hypothetical protein